MDKKMKSSFDDIASLLPIRRGSDPHKKPLFLVHDGSGNLLAYRHFIGRFDKRTPLYGLTPSTLSVYCQQNPKELIRKLASKYVEAIISVQAKGPYNVCGYCMGGIITLEIARQLASLKHKVGNLIIINSAKVPYIVEDEIYIFYVFTRYMGLPVERIGFDFADTDLRNAIETVSKNTAGCIKNGEISKLDDSSGCAHIARIWRCLERQGENHRIENAYQVYNEALNGDGFLSKDKFHSLFHVYRQSIKATMESDNSSYLEGNFILILAHSEVSFFPAQQSDMLEFWKNYCCGNVKVNYVPGNHYTIMGSDNVLNITQIIESELAMG